MTATDNTFCGMNWISWRSIFAGALTAVAVSIVMAVLGIALGFTVVHPLDHDPLSGLPLTFGIWSFVSIIVSLGLGGFIAGFFSGNRGCEHGFLVWAAVLVFGAFFTTVAVGSALKTVGSVVGQGAITAASAAGQSATDLAVAALERYQRQPRPDGMAGMNEGPMAILRDTGIDVLQPDTMREQMRDARSDLRKTLNQLRLHPDKYDEIISAFLNKQKQRLETVAGQVDREAAVTGLMQNRNISREQAEMQVDSALRVFRRHVKQAEGALTDMQQQVQDTKEFLDDAAKTAREEADAMASAAAKSAFVAALALILGAIVGGLAGLWGNRMSLRCFR